MNDLKRQSSIDPAEPMPDPALAIAQVRAWVERAVIGLNLCPFAGAAARRRRIRYVHCAATDSEALLAAFGDEVRLLLTKSPEEIETSLLIHPGVLADFDDYNDFLDDADAAVEALGGAGIVQVASFHPQYRFAGTDAGDIENATNRSPWPILQLLREDSVSAAALAFPDSVEIYEANIEKLRSLGHAGWAALQAECARDAALAVAGSGREASAGEPSRGEA